MSAKEDASILKIACFVLPSVSGDTKDAYKKAEYAIFGCRPCCLDRSCLKNADDMCWSNDVKANKSSTGTLRRVAVILDARIERVTSFITFFQRQNSVYNSDGPVCAALP
ncbi:hypothetical protein I315_05522 [Cryptococcus gattii Ru294]|uniref:Uncharacterized protein n=2 Tax=Cryptococcus gattii TaxID=37769 RepID=E6R8U8_CRYGW|nr:Hypothetical Protein CGB_G0230W [Cryptococcus gattii WM276]KIR51886.1 hypothetical protein I315_05522 [Cryptococcus gattii Ru294]KIR77815.1 hypothetical protein I306_05049 [Cryptococcus gattii EJB2]KIY31898.1 hypothetical protein I305_05532 [Cryptococcus gattii E566]KJE03164.1 hypothetical protein I311_02983 [Cryptococcus gattii NT-10]ADV23241.1 Hypothetical Protein CGB_G0230W [Cryptococcus gattii WM276]